jgi:hypothetical protein
MKIIEYRRGETIVDGVKTVQTIDGVDVEGPSIVEGEHFEARFTRDDAVFKIPLGNGDGHFLPVALTGTRYTAGELRQLGKALVALADLGLQ